MSDRAYLQYKSPIQRESDAILESLAPIKKVARENGWLIQHTGMHNEIRVTADELDKLNAGGRCIWGPPNWRLDKVVKKKCPTCGHVSETVTVMRRYD